MESPYVFEFRYCSFQLLFFKWWTFCYSQIYVLRFRFTQAVSPVTQAIPNKSRTWQNHCALGTDWTSVTKLGWTALIPNRLKFWAPAEMKTQTKAGLTLKPINTSWTKPSRLVDEALRIQKVHASLWRRYPYVAICDSPKLFRCCFYTLVATSFTSKFFGWTSLWSARIIVVTRRFKSHNFSAHSSIVMSLQMFAQHL